MKRIHFSFYLYKNNVVKKPLIVLPGVSTEHWASNIKSIKTQDYGNALKPTKPDAVGFLKQYWV